MGAGQSNMTGDAATNKRLSSKLDIPYPDVSKLPEAVKKKFDGLPTEQGSFRWPSLREGVMRLTPGQLVALLEGFQECSLW